MITPSTKTMGRDDRSTNASRWTMLVMPALFAVLLVLIPVTAAASISGDNETSGDAKCLKCHAKNLKKSLEDGENLALHVEQSQLENSVHRKISCTGCHQAIAGKKHPAKESISSKRAFSLEMNQNCRRCHGGKFSQYEGSIHANLVAEGNVAAPVCTDCHSAHAVQVLTVNELASGLPCKNCHKGIYDAYAQSVHGKARTEGNAIRPSHVQAPACADCHRAHDVNAVAAGEQLKAACLNCHREAPMAHQKWLPNAELHLSAVSCPACHSPLAERRVDLELYDKLTQVPVGQQDDNGIGERLNAIDKSGDGIDALELWQLVKKSGQEGRAVDVTLRGRMTVDTGVEAHQLAVKASAVRNCDSCHREGSRAFQNVTVSIVSPDGRKKYFGADKNVLSSMVSVDSISDFYAMGGTRIKLLDVLLVLGLIGGLAIPVGHLTIGRLLKKKRQKEN